MAPGIFRKIFDKVKGFFSGGDDSPASNLIDRVKDKVNQVSDGARRVIDKVNETIDYAEPVIRKGIKTTGEVLDYAEPVVEQAQRIVRKIRRPPPKVVEVEEYESDEPAPPPPIRKRAVSKVTPQSGLRPGAVTPRTFTPYTPIRSSRPAIDFAGNNDDDDYKEDENRERFDERSSEPPAIRKQTSKFESEKQIVNDRKFEASQNTRSKLRPQLKRPKLTPQTEFYSD
jgi:hypothetical protein